MTTTTTTEPKYNVATGILLAGYEKVRDDARQALVYATAARRLPDRADFYLDLLAAKVREIESYARDVHDRAAAITGMRPMS